MSHKYDSLFTTGGRTIIEPERSDFEIDPASWTCSHGFRPVNPI